MGTRKKKTDEVEGTESGAPTETEQQWMERLNDSDANIFPTLSDEDLETLKELGKTTSQELLKIQCKRIQDNRKIYGR